jgi:vacuolar-type H+-ATPase subunit F/Vma7
MHKLIACILFIGFAYSGFSQYDPAFNSYYRNEIDNLKANYHKEDVKLEVVILYNDWLKDIKKEKEAISDKQANPIFAQRLEDLGNLEEMVINEMTNKKPKDEELVEEDSTMLAGNMPDSLMESTEDMAKEVEEPKADTIDVATLPVKDEAVPADTLGESIDFNETEKEEKKTTSSFAKLLTNEIPGVYYRVQVLASAKQKPGVEIAANLNLKEEIVEEQHNGLYKYLVGKFSIYASAKARAEALKSETGVAAFVVGYKQEKRTTLSEIFGN